MDSSVCHNDPSSRRSYPAVLVVAGLLLVPAASGQEVGRPAAGLKPAWQRIGNSALDLSLASPATGPVDRVWFSDTGTTLFARTRSGDLFEAEDFEAWKQATGVQPPNQDNIPAEPRNLPVDVAGYVRAAGASSSRLYALGQNVYRSDDGGRHWANLTGFRHESIIGAGMKDLAVSPADPDQVVVANEEGIWRSMDGGLSWTGLNESLPNLPVKRLLSAPAGTRGMRILTDGIGPVEWTPGETQAWRPVRDIQTEEQDATLAVARARLGTAVTAVAIFSEYSYAGARDGRLWVSSDKGLTWRLSRPAVGSPVEALFVDPSEPRLALAVATGTETSGRVLRTFNGGLFWDDLTANLPAGSVHGVTADRASGTVYVATDRGVFLARTELFGSGEGTDWIPMSESLPRAVATDVMLDPSGNQLYVALEGYGIYTAPAPHRYWDPRVVNTADLSGRPAAPGSLLSVLGARLRRAQAGLLDAPVLHASDLESQIQVPFEAESRVTRLFLDSAREQITLELPVRDVSPAIFVDRDGTPLLLDGDTGVLLDALNPARSNARLQILATGLGRVKPDWPTGRAAPLESPPQVIAPVRVFLDRVPLEVTRATLAPGYVGFYLVEVQLPSIVNMGPAELYIQAGDSESNRVRVYLEP